MNHFFKDTSFNEYRKDVYGVLTVFLNMTYSIPYV